MAQRPPGPVRENSLSSFKELQMSTAKSALDKSLKELALTAADVPAAQQHMNRFSELFGRYLGNAEQDRIHWDKIEPPPPGMVQLYESLASVPEDAIADLLDKLVVVKLNGGLGTTMGCTGPKSVIEVRDDMTFLDLTVRQVEWLNETYGCEVPLILMNSFNTHDDTDKIIQKYSASNVTILTFNQSRFPRINKESLLPVTDQYDGGNSNWYPPGHGDVYDSMKESGVLDGLLAKGKEVMFMSNIDNLGATVDITILQHFSNSDAEFAMEVTPKTQADVKGGTLISYEGQCRLLEIAQVAKDHVEEFKSIKKFRIFNTNNLWMKLEAVDRVVVQKELSMEIIENIKSMSDGTKVIQLEQAVGAGIKHFKNACGITVPRSRFLPVKTCSDLFVVKSNLYTIQHGTLVMNPARPFPTVPLVKLGDGHFKKVHEFLGRMSGIPDIVELNHLTVTGDVTFGKKVVLRGTVIIVANHGDRIDIPSGAVFENKVVSGNMRILDH
ncbi:UTP-glucose-1-phosphate uridylyltransferase [Sphaeroforma arctica JP610]|uniref:UTP--glucose-1-phosphate uridylyltransferase n=1 Tax=Sphaeroforma arctica JP610 TaxID=667725 RepID=A0A0L0G448_9EUKA|nr:UTP-glucose-1-phosphate uridylyltransferase [Sphaeroforma arctica JP610]KNC83634.1 UTP-glucose-1-phosphate uridylyltransferase [Sphaeroforma arctica JP610]|eukprot:XP_014157536.1 UTP-glucose-1-phosphate uridylyltransferase [Sphaeroforma arctica JP610]